MAGLLQGGTRRARQQTSLLRCYCPHLPLPTTSAHHHRCSAHHLLCGNRAQMECNIAAFAAELDAAEVAATYRQHAQQRLDAITELLWEEGSGQWRDLILEPEASSRSGSSGAAAAAGVSGPPPPVAAVSSSFRRSTVVAASNWVPLYGGCAPAGSPMAAAAVASLRRSGLVQAAGLAVSLEETGQQWDAPNSWPPITCMLLEGCERYGGAEGDEVSAGRGALVAMGGE